MNREVLQQALEALEACIDYIAPHTVQGEKDGDMADAAIATIKAALAQQSPHHEYDKGFSNGWDKCAARHATAQPDNTSKLYEELRSIIDGGSESFTHADAVKYLKDNLTPQEHAEQMARLGWQYFECPACGSAGARAFPKPEQEPVAWVCYGATYKHDIDFEEDVVNAIPVGTELYTSPPKRQPLTLDCYDAGLLSDFGGGNVDWWQDYIRAELDRAHDFYQSQAAHGIGEKT